MMIQVFKYKYSHLQRVIIRWSKENGEHEEQGSEIWNRGLVKSEEMGLLGRLQYKGSTTWIQVC